MKKTLIGFGILSLLYLSSCKTSADEVPALNRVKAESILDFDCVRNSADVPLTIADAKKGIYGEWQLKGTILYAPLPEDLPDIRLKISEKSTGKQLVEIFENGKLAKTMTFDFTQGQVDKLYWVTLKPDFETFADGSYNYIRGTIRLCPTELMIDNGMAFDAPAYLYRKIK
ncbi:hypothetical protein [Emticicia sp. 21SJ11W-3]|uniref:hypothetical protein n=1 Tax=Emticicia sp. 21SJ11W-3 TaxID=2916755 RepID=UPI0020A09AF6|nr:hypothetical protein [Emticicia sp. 21SJ11W-3]UTA67106.1 hypothetical protein MB380_16040 [Emticicia sp. 21SJ11W-3]